MLVVLDKSVCWVCKLIHKIDQLFDLISESGVEYKIDTVYQLMSL